MKKAVLITGASTGIGLASAIELSKTLKVFAGVRKTEDERKIQDFKNPNLVPIRIDVADPASISSAVREIQNQLSGEPLWGLINNAGVAIGGPIETLPMQRFREQFEVNVFGLIATTQAFLPQIRKAEGRVVNISSISGLLATPFLGPYCGSKFAVEAISDALRRELMQYNVKVSIVEPGPIQTPIWQKSLGRKEEFLEGASEEALGVYGPMMESFEKAIVETEKSAVPVEKVVEKIVHAITSERPKTRYLVGPSSRFVSVMKKWAPDRFLDKMMVLKIKSGKPARSL